MNRLENIFLHVLGQCADLKAEDVLIVSDLKYDKAIVDAIRAAAKRFGARPIALTIDIDVLSEGSIPESVLASMKTSNLVLLCTHVLIPHRIRREAVEAGARLISMSGVDRETVKRCFDVDYEELSKVTRALAETLQSAKDATFNTGSGTNLNVRLSGRKSVFLDGTAKIGGQLSALPAGVVAVAPLEGTAKGTLAIDASIAGIGIVDSPIRCIVEDGRIVDISGGRDARKFRRLLSEGGPTGFCVAEVGAGTNRRAKYSGNLLEDERVYASGHIGFGENTRLGGTIESKIHIDATMKRPKICVDGREVINLGKIKIPEKSQSHRD